MDHPVLPTAAIDWPALTYCPELTYNADACMYTLSTPPPWSITTQFPALLLYPQPIRFRWPPHRSDCHSLRRYNTVVAAAAPILITESICQHCRIARPNPSAAIGRFRSAGHIRHITAAAAIAGSRCFLCRCFSSAAAAAAAARISAQSSASACCSMEIFSSSSAIYSSVYSIVAFKD